MNHDAEQDFEAALTVLLEQRASRAVVTTDAHPPTISRSRRERSTSGSTRWWLAVAAVLVVLVATGPVLRSVDRRPDPLASASAPDSGRLPGGHDLTVWMHPGVEPAQIRDVAALLETSEAVDDVVYLDHAATYVEFVEYFADQPEIIDLVEPENLPPSFRVRTGASDRVVELVRDRPGVDEVEVEPDE